MLGKWKDRTLLGLRGSEDSSEEMKGTKQLQGWEPCEQGRKTRLKTGWEVGGRMQALAHSPAHPARSSTANTTSSRNLPDLQYLPCLLSSLNWLVL